MSPFITQCKEQPAAQRSSSAEAEAELSIGSVKSFFTLERMKTIKHVNLVFGEGRIVFPVHSESVTVINALGTMGPATGIIKYVTASAACPSTNCTAECRDRPVSSSTVT